MLKKTTFFLVLSLLFVADVSAQCSMCRAVAESSYAGGQNIGKGLNDGILYLMGIPYIIIIAFGYYLFRRITKVNSAQNA